MDDKASWRFLTEDERVERFERLGFPGEVKLVNPEKVDCMEISFPIALLHEIIDRLIECGYVTIDINVFHEGGSVVVDAWMLRDHGLNEPAGNFL